MAPETFTIAPVSGGQITPFDYSQLEHDVAVEARKVAARIRDRISTTYIEIGRDLASTKDRLEHGQFFAWVTAEFGMTARTAENYMNAARFLRDKNETLSLLPPTAIYALAAPSAPAAIVDQVLAAAHAGAPLSVREIREKLADAREAARKAEVDAKKSAEQIKEDSERERRSRAAHEARTRKAEEQRRQTAAERLKKAHAVAEFLVHRLGGEGVLALSNMLRGVDWYQVTEHFYSSHNFPLPASKIEEKFKDASVGEVAT